MKWKWKISFFFSLSLSLYLEDDFENNKLMPTNITNNWTHSKFQQPTPQQPQPQPQQQLQKTTSTSSISNSSRNSERRKLSRHQTLVMRSSIFDLNLLPVSLDDFIQHFESLKVSIGSDDDPTIDGFAREFFVSVFLQFHFISFFFFWESFEKWSRNKNKCKQQQKKKN